MGSPRGQPSIYQVSPASLFVDHLLSMNQREVRHTLGLSTCTGPPTSYIAGWHASQSHYTAHAPEQSSLYDPRLNGAEIAEDTVGATNTTSQSSTLPAMIYTP